MPHNSKSRNILTTNVSEKSNNIRYYVRSNKKAAPFNVSTITSPDTTIQHSSVLTENDKVAWPIPYSRNIEPEFKWKIVRPTNIPHQQNQIDTNNQTIEMNEENLAPEIEMASNDSSHHQEESTHIYPPFTSEQSQSQSYHPYEFENVHSLSNINMPPTTYSPSLDDIYAQSIDHSNETIKSEENGHHTKHSEVHIDHIDNA